MEKGQVAFGDVTRLALPLNLLGVAVGLSNPEQGIITVHFIENFMQEDERIERLTTVRPEKVLEVVGNMSPERIQAGLLASRLTYRHANPVLAAQDVNDILVRGAKTFEN